MKGLRVSRRGRIQLLKATAKEKWTKSCLQERIKLKQKRQDSFAEVDDGEERT